MNPKTFNAAECLRDIRDVINRHLGEEPSPLIPTTMVDQINTIIDHVANEYEYDPAAFRRANHKHKPARLTLARRVACYLCRKLTTASNVEIGDVFDYCRSAVSHSALAIQDRLDTDPVFKKEVARIEADLKIIFQIAEENKALPLPCSGEGRGVGVSPRFQTANQLAHEIKRRSNFFGVQRHAGAVRAGRPASEASPFRA